MHRLRRILLIVAAIWIMIPWSYPVVQAETDKQTKEDIENEGFIASKDEVIYATLQARGDKKEVFVVNMLQVTKAGTITDYGDYSSVKNLTDLSEMQQTGDKIQVAAPKGKFYYQGNMDDAVLPWDFAITYRLDQQKVEPEELIGKSGQVTIEIDVRRNEKVDATFFENYLLQIALPFDADRTNNIVAEDAVIASAGKDELVTFTVMPETEETFTVEADVENFEMDGIEISGVPSTIGIDAPDTDDMTGDIKTLSDAIAEVNAGVADLKSGIWELNEGTSTLENGSQQYKAGIDELDQSSAALIQGSSEMNEGLQTLNDALKGLDDIDLGALQELQTGVSGIASSFKEAQEDIAQLRDSYKQAYQALDKAMNNLPSHTVSQEEIRALEESNADKATIKKLVETYEAAQAVKTTFNEVKQGFLVVDTTLEMAVDALAETSNAVDQLVAELGGALDKFEIDQGISELTSGVNSLARNYGQFHDGLVSYTGGVSELAKSYHALDDGIVKVSGGTGALADGVSELHQGTNKLAQSTSDLPAEMTEEIDKMIAEYDKSDFEKVSFVNPEKNEDIFAVQFVFQTESLKLEEPESAEDKAEEKKGFWEKFMDLFR